MEFENKSSLEETPALGFEAELYFGLDFCSTPDFVESVPSTPDSYASIASLPTSPSSLETNAPLKSALKKGGGFVIKKNVRWCPDVVFETRPLTKRCRNQIKQEMDDDVMDAPNAKRQKCSETENQSFVPIFPTASRSVIPSFNFSALERSIAMHSTESKKNLSSSPDASRMEVSSTPQNFVSFSFACVDKRRSNCRISSLNPTPIYQQ